MNRLLLILTLTALSISHAQAADGGLYLGIGAGQAQFKDDNGSANSDAFKAFLGWRIKAIPLLDFAAEAGYHYFGKATHTAISQPVTQRMDGGSVAGLAILPLGPVDLFAKGGAIYSTLRTDIGGSNTSRSSTDPFYGAGVGFNIGSIGIRAEYEYFDVSNLKRMQAYTASVVIRF